MVPQNPPAISTLKKHFAIVSSKLIGSKILVLNPKYYLKYSWKNGRKIYILKIYIFSESFKIYENNVLALKIYDRVVDLGVMPKEAHKIHPVKILVKKIVIF